MHLRYRVSTQQEPSAIFKPKTHLVEMSMFFRDLTATEKGGSHRPHQTPPSLVKDSDSGICSHARRLCRRRAAHPQLRAARTNLLAQGLQLGGALV